MLRAEHQKVAPCGQCGGAVNLSVVFCPACGAIRNLWQAPTETIKDNLCRRCYERDGSYSKLLPAAFTCVSCKAVTKMPAAAAIVLPGPPAPVKKDKTSKTLGTVVTLIFVGIAIVRGAMHSLEHPTPGPAPAGGTAAAGPQPGAVYAPDYPSIVRELLGDIERGYGLEEMQARNPTATLQPVHVQGLDAEALRVENTLGEGGQGSFTYLFKERRLFQAGLLVDNRSGACTLDHGLLRAALDGRLGPPQVVEGGQRSPALGAEDDMVLGTRVAWARPGATVILRCTHHRPDNPYAAAARLSITAEALGLSEADPGASE